MNTNKPSEQELAPCPFCNGKAIIERKGSAKCSMQIGCSNCNVCLESGDVFGLTEPKHYAWNTRTTPQPKASEISLDILQRIANKWESFYFQNTPKITVADAIKLGIEEWNTPQPKACGDSERLDWLESHANFELRVGHSGLPEIHVGYPLCPTPPLRFQIDECLRAMAAMSKSGDSKSLDVLEPIPMVDTSVDKVSKSGEK